MRLDVRTWAALVPRAAFGLFACWEQAKLTGNEVTLAILSGIWTDRAERSGWPASVTMRDDGILLLELRR